MFITEAFWRTAVAEKADGSIAEFVILPPGTEAIRIYEKRKPFMG